MSPANAVLAGRSLVARSAAAAAGALEFNEAFLVGGAMVIVVVLSALLLSAKPIPQLPRDRSA